ncbi:MAG TPA: HD domain-containing phosphohydrolase [Geobacteraceae bacterium]|nr:HD domain-containing phosphohydrolase [Geobacteraceae bacterium]
MSKRFGTYREEIERLTGLADVDEVLKGLSRLLKRTMKTLWAVVYLLDQERHDFAPARSCGLPARYLPLFREMPLPHDKIPLLKNILRKKQHLLIPNASASSLLTPKLRAILQDLTLLAVPMIVRNQVTGVVFVARANDYPPFSDDEIAAIRLMISHAALVVSHIRLFDNSLEMAVEMARRIDVIFTLDEINKAISSSLSHTKIIETAIEHIERIVQCEFVGVLVEEKGDLVVRATRASNVVAPDTFGPGTRLTGQNLAGSVFAKGESRYVPSLKRLKRVGAQDRALRDAGVESLLAIPLSGKESTNGVLLLGDSRPGRFGPEDAFAIEKVAAQMAVALENARLYEEMRELFINTVASLANAIDAKSPWTKGHSERVMHLAAAIAAEMGLDEATIERIRLGGLLHDIGKIGIIEALLEKPAMLSEDEFPPLRLHPEKGVGILAPIAQLQDVLPGILHHHERYDGKGYPAGLKGKAIPLEARVITVADSFDAIVSARPYKKGLSVAAALAELQKCAGTQFDPEVVDSLVSYIGKREKGRMAA